MKLSAGTKTLMTGSLLAAACLAPAVAQADTVTSRFEAPEFAPGHVNGVQGWKSLGAAGQGGTLYDHQVTTLTTLGLAGDPIYANAFGSAALRISNARAGAYGDQTYSASVPNEAGESSAESGGQSGGERQRIFDAAFTIASATPGVEQPGLQLDVSPDRGDGARMSLVRFIDGPGGIAVSFNDYDHATGNFINKPLTTISNTVPHRVKIHMEFVDGVLNDIVTFNVDGVDVTPVGARTWEDYYRDQELHPTRTVDSLLFRSRVAAPSTENFGYLIDNVSTTTPAFGTTGPVGPVGPAGPGGTPGTPGAPGTPGTPGTPGADGDDGAPGLPGAPGTPGANGNDGTNGNDGAPGSNGNDGNDGATGNNGATGATGANGATGATGAAGATGALLAETAGVALPKASLQGTTARSAPTGVRVRVKCAAPAKAKCKGTVTLRSTTNAKLGSLTFNVKPGQRFVTIKTKAPVAKAVRVRASIQQTTGGKTTTTARYLKVV